MLQKVPPRLLRLIGSSAGSPLTSETHGCSSRKSVVAGTRSERSGPMSSGGSPVCPAARQPESGSSIGFWGHPLSPGLAGHPSGFEPDAEEASRLDDRAHSRGANRGLRPNFL
jgi:hypothetical protein